MPFTLAGLPSHILIVHAVVVLVPLAVLGSILVALWPAARRRHGWLVVVLTAVAAGCIPLATGTGDDLRDRLATTDLIREHAHLGDELLAFVICLLALVTALVALDSRRRARSETELPRGRGILLALAVLTTATAVTSAVQVVRIGDSGARAAWADAQYVAPHHDHH